MARWYFSRLEDLPINKVLVETGVSRDLKVPLQQCESYVADRAVARHI